MMKEFFKKFNKPQNEVEDLDTGYDSEYYQGAYDRRAAERPVAQDRPMQDRWEETRGYEERIYQERPVQDRPAQGQDRWEERYTEDRRYAEPTAYNRYDDRRDMDVNPSRGWQEAEVPGFRDRADDYRTEVRPAATPAEPVFAPAPAPEYLYFTPSTYRDCREGIVKGLSSGHVVVVRLGGLEATDVLRLFDYMMGAVQALDGELVRPRATTVVLLPNGVELDETELDLADADEDEDDADDEYEDDEYEDDEYEDEEYEDEYDESEEDEYDDYEEDDGYDGEDSEEDAE